MTECNNDDERDPMALDMTGQRSARYVSAVMGGCFFGVAVGWPDRWQHPVAPRGH